MERDSAQRRAYEAVDAMQAGLMVAHSIGDGPAVVASKSVGMEKTKLEGKTKLYSAKLVEMKTMTQTTFKSIADRIKALHSTGSDQELTGSPLEFMQDLQKKANSATNYIDAKKDELDSLVATIQETTTVPQVKDKQAVIDTIWKSLKKSPHSEFGVAAGSARRHLAKEEARSQKMATDDCVVHNAPPAPPLMAILKTLLETAERQISSTIYEVKAGVRPARCSTLQGKDPIAELKSNAYLKKYARRSRHTCRALVP